MELNETEREIVAWLRAENKLCDCFARSSGECACGVWDGMDKSWTLDQVATAIESGSHRKEG